MTNAVHYNKETTAEIVYFYRHNSRDIRNESTIPEADWLHWQIATIGQDLRRSLSLLHVLRRRMDYPALKRAVVEQTLAHQANPYKDLMTKSHQ